MECLSLSVAETTKKITKRTRPEDRTYELHVQLPHYPQPKTEGSTMGIDVGVHNMLATATPEDRSMKLVKMEHDAKRYKHDEISRLLSKRSRLKRNGRRWSKTTRKIRRLLARQQNVKADCIRQTISKELKGAKTVVAENLDVSSMLAKVKNSGIIPKKEQSKAKAGKAAPSRHGRKRGSRGLRRAVQNAPLGMVKAWIIHYCLKNGITLYMVNPKYTSRLPRVQACSETVKERCKVPLHFVWNGILCRQERGNKRPEQGTFGDGAIPGGREDRRETEGRYGSLH